MNKQELVTEVAKLAEITKTDAEKAVTAVFASMAKALEDGAQVSIMGFGTFTPKTRAARVGTHPSTGEKINIPASKTVAFKPSKSLKG